MKLAAYILPLVLLASWLGYDEWRIAQIRHHEHAGTDSIIEDAPTKPRKTFVVRVNESLAQQVVEHPGCKPIYTMNRDTMARVIELQGKRIEQLESRVSTR